MELGYFEFPPLSQTQTNFPWIYPACFFSDLLSIFGYFKIFSYFKLPAVSN